MSAIPSVSEAWHVLLSLDTDVKLSARDTAWSGHKALFLWCTVGFDSTPPNTLPFLGLEGAGELPYTSLNVSLSFDICMLSFPHGLSYPRCFWNVLVPSVPLTVSLNSCSTLNIHLSCCSRELSIPSVPQPPGQKHQTENQSMCLRVGRSSFKLLLLQFWGYAEELFIALSISAEVGSECRGTGM